MRKLEFISLFSGGGGLDIGFEMAGWECLYASDIDRACVETLQRNQGKEIDGVVMLENALIEQADVRQLDGADLLKRIGRKKGEVPLLVGGPPCQSWSSAGNQLGFLDPRGQLFRDYVRVADQTGVRWIVFENVRGLLTARGPDGQPGSALQHIRESLLAAGFQTEVELLNSADYGVPQRRVRLCLIGFREGDRPSFPSPTHHREESLGSEPWVSLADAITGIAPLDENEVIRPNAQLLAQLEDLPPGSGVKSPGKAETTRPGGHWGYKQGAFVADPTLPARTVTAGSQQDWINDPELGLRRLHPRECAAIQTFPEDWVFSGNRLDQYRQIGNAVPPKLAYAIATELATHFNATGRRRLSLVQTTALNPLRRHLLSAITYTQNDDRKNGESRRSAPSLKRIRMKA